MYTHHNKEFDVRISEKPAYTGIGIEKLVKISEEPGTDLVIFVGKKRLFKRKKLEEFLETHDSA